MPYLLFVLAGFVLMLLPAIWDTGRRRGKRRKASKTPRTVRTQRVGCLLGSDWRIDDR